MIAFRDPHFKLKPVLWFPLASQALTKASHSVHVALAGLDLVRYLGWAPAVRQVVKALFTVC